MLLIAIAFWPTPVDRPVDGRLSQILAYLWAHGWPSWFDYGFVEASANVVLFVPGGFLLALLLGRFWWLAIAAGLLASTLIEMVQGFLLPARYANMQDVVVNTCGSAVGALLAYLVTRMGSGTRAEEGRS